MAQQRTTENFVKLLQELEAKTAGNPTMLMTLRHSDASVEIIVNELHALFGQIEHHRKHAKKRYIVQAHPQFLEALNQYRTKWSSSWLTYYPEIDLSDLGEPPGNPNSGTHEVESSQVYELEDEWDFDPDTHSAATHLLSVVEGNLWKADQDAFHSRLNGAWDWMLQTMGLDLSGMERRWREFPVLVIKQSVSNKHGLNESRGLFAYLEEIRTAYVAGTYLAAVAMCRATNEIILRYHYSPNDEDTKLGKLIDRICEKYDWMNKSNFAEKVRTANRLMHASATFEISGREEARQLVWNWIAPLQELIQRAPEEPNLVQQ
jgi:hypothetical protein